MSEASEPSVPQLVVSLEIVERWREETETEVTRQIKEIDEEEERLNANIAELQRQLKAVAALREEMQVRLTELDDEELARIREAVLSGLESEAPLLAERDIAWTDACTARASGVEALVEDPRVAALLEEFRQFAEVEPTLDLLPAGYRRALLAHHEEVKRELQPVIAAAQADPEPMDLDPAGFTLIASLDPPDGPPEALAVIVPVPFDTYARWSEQREDLHSLIAYRVVGALSALLAEVGAADAPMQYAPYEDKLAVQVWLGDSEVTGDIRSTFEALIDGLKREAAELRVTRLEPYLVWLSPDAIIPEEGEEDGEDDGDDGEDDYNG